ncbi:MAG TPA: chromosome partitioning protein ParA [Lachnospiraceae bacterium]|nr:chromosome partitioning protein ParA [Lachnospiraceae bacterium]
MDKNGKVVSFINMKGGVGKTTLCLGMGEFLAHSRNKKVLYIDLDPQFNLTQSVMNEYDLEEEYMANYSKSNTVKKIFETPTIISEKPKLPEINDVILDMDDNISIIAGTINLIYEDNNKSNSASKRIKKFIDDKSLRDTYDFIFIDCPPTISLFTDSALIASDYYLIPVKVDRYSILGIKLLNQVVERLMFEEMLNLKCLGIVYTGIESNQTDKTKKIMKTLEDSEMVRSVGIFKSYTHFVRDLMVGLQGNISSKYIASKQDMEDVCNEFVRRINN